MRSPYGFIRTAGRGSAYCTQGGHHWIIRVGRTWHLIQMGNKTEGRERVTLGTFPTLTEAANHYERNVKQ